MHSDDRPGIAERVGRALSRGNMRQREGACDLDTVGALGMVGLHERLADAVYRLKYANDPGSYDDALVGVYRLARAMNGRNGWRLRSKALHWMAKRVLNYWLNDACRVCTGVGYEVIHGSPHLSDRPCPKCHGTRKLAFPWVRRFPRKPEGRFTRKAKLQRWYDVSTRLRNSIHRHHHLLAELERCERVIGEKMIAKLAREVRL